MADRYIELELLTAGSSFVRKIKPSTTDCTLRYNAASTAYLTIPAAHSAIPQLMVDGVRAAVWMVTENEGAPVQKERLMEGPVGDLYGDGPFGTVTIPVVDDFDWFWKVLGWQKPTAALNAQNVEYARYTGKTETRALAAIAANVTRLGLPWNVPASSGRGSDGTTEFRMHSLASRLIPILTAARLQLTLERNRATGMWDVGIRTGTTYSRPLTPQSGVLGAWRWKRQRPQYTRMIAGGAGEGVDREFGRVINSTLETQLGRIMEGFDDSRMAEAGADLTIPAAEALAAAAGMSGIEATLRESAWFRFGDAYRIGTKVTLQAGAMTATDVISEIQIRHNTTDGFVVTPKVGFTVDDPQAKLTRFVADLAASVRTLERR